MAAHYIGIDIGGTSIKAGLIENGKLQKTLTADTQAHKGGETTLKVIEKLITQLITPTTEGIGIGVPGIVDRQKGIAYDIWNIKDWGEVHLKSILESEFSVSVSIDNDANCFAMGEKLFGKGSDFNNFVGVTLGTGVGAGIIQRGRLMDDANCGSGEFGGLPYKDTILEDYCASHFFKHYHKIDGKTAYEKAKAGDAHCIKLFEEFALHLSVLVKTIMLTIDPQAIIFGGAIAKSFELFEPFLREQMKEFPFQKSVAALTLLSSDLENAGIYGAAAICQS